MIAFLPNLLIYHHVIQIPISSWNGKSASTKILKTCTFRINFSVTESIDGLQVNIENVPQKFLSMGFQFWNSGLDKEIYL